MESIVRNVKHNLGPEERVMLFINTKQCKLEKIGIALRPVPHILIDLDLGQLIFNLIFLGLNDLSTDDF